MKAILTKLLAVQAEVGAISKDSTNPFFKSKYFDINGLLEHVKPILTAYGLVLVQPLTIAEGRTGIATMILDAETGEKVEGFMPLPNLDDPQKMGSAITYFRRYALQSLLALQAEDDDGNVASTKKPTPADKKASQGATSHVSNNEVIEGDFRYKVVNAKNGKTFYIRELVSNPDLKGEFFDSLEDMKADIALNRKKQ